MQIFLVPLLLLVISLTGLVFALFVYGAADTLATFAVAIPLVVIAWAIVRTFSEENG